MKVQALLLVAVPLISLPTAVGAAVVGGAPLPVVGAGVPVLLLAVLGYFVYRKRWTK